MLFEIYTATKMYTVEADYFIANQDGVMFFDRGNNGIAFCPNTNLHLVRLNIQNDEKMRREILEALKK